MRRTNPEEETDVRTTVRRLTDTANPKRQNLIHHIESNKSPKITPEIIKNNQKIQLKRERTTVLLRTNIGSLRTTLLKNKSKKKVTTKRAIPISNPLSIPSFEKKKADDNPMIKQMEAISTIAFLKEGK